MFIEPGSQKGWIEVICGCMFSGKTEELIRRVKRAKIAGLQTRVFKPTIDSRYSKIKVVSHDNKEYDSFPVENSKEIIQWTLKTDVVGIDEAQFFDEGLIEVVNKLANQGKRVVVAGLDKDFLAQPFGVMPQLMAIAEYVTKVYAICVRCGNTASYSFRKTKSQKQVELGEKDTYEARCRQCFYDSFEG